MSDKKIPLMECFGPTLQGEGEVIGLQTYFLRFGLCDMRCKMCDSMHAVDPMRVKANGQWLTQEEIFEVLYDQRFGKDRKQTNTTNWVTFSGGNPCIHDLTLLAQNLKTGGWNIAVETQGTHCPRWLQMCDIITISPKGPGMGEECDLDKLDAFMENMDYGDFSMMKANLKVVAFDERDLEFARMLIERYVLEKQYQIRFFISQGNPYPPGMVDDQNYHLNEHVDALRDGFLKLLDSVQNDPLLSRVKVLPQFHVWLWGNKQGV